MVYKAVALSKRPVEQHITLRGRRIIGLSCLSQPSIVELVGVFLRKLHVHSIFDARVRAVCMGSLRVSILFKPRLYADLICRLFQNYRSVELVDIPLPAKNGHAARPKEEGYWPVDVVVMSIGEYGQPDIHLLPRPMPEATLIALSPRGDYGLRRQPGQGEWEEVRPYNLPLLVQEVVALAHPAG